MNILRAALLLLFLAPATALGQPAGQSASSRGASVHYTVHGSGARTLVLVHGWTCDESSWARQIDALAPTFRVVTVDLPGHGKSGAPTGPFSMAAFADAIEAVRTAIKADTLVLVGHSMGTTVITRYAQQYPQHVAALVVVDGLLAGPELRPQLRKMLIVAPDANEPAMRREFIKGMFSPATTPADQARIVAMMTATSEATARGAMTAMLADDALLSAPVKAPAFGIYAGGPELPMDFTRKMLPGLREVKIPGTGHFLMMEKPSEFNAALLEFVNAVK
jgi:pimeloyl-ACP methyl ester carboxylesterase